MIVLREHTCTYMLAITWYICTLVLNLDAGYVITEDASGTKSAEMESR